MRRQIHRAVQLAALGRELAGSKRHVGVQKRDAQVRIVERLERLHGLPQKIGQILSLSELRSETAVYRRLTEGKAVLSLAEVKRRITDELGAPWNACFRSIDSPGIGASLSQVHRATLQDGRTVAVKVQLPEVAESVAMDLKALGWLTAPVGGLRRGFDLAGYRREVGKMLREELDFRHEAAVLRTFRAFATQIPGIAVPQVIEELSNDVMLTMTWIEGDAFAVVKKWPERDRAQIGQTLLDLFFASIFGLGLFHADPHPGNYRFSLCGDLVTVGLLDFGCTKALPTETVEALRAIIEDTINGVLVGDSGRALSRFTALGFHEGLLAPMETRLPELCEILFEPLLVNADFNLSEWRLGDRVSTVLGDYRWNFRAAGPPSLIYFMRAYQGLIQYLSALDVPLNWRAAFEAAVPFRNEERREESADTNPSASLTRVMKIRVVRDGVTRAELTFPATAAENLVELLPEGVQPRLTARGIDADAISQRAVETGFPSGELFHLQDGNDDFAVWLE